jgi:hypothetical protein
VARIFAFWENFWVKIAALCLLVKFDSKQKLQVKKKKKKKEVKRNEVIFEGFNC